MADSLSLPLELSITFEHIGFAPRPSDCQNTYCRITVPCNGGFRFLLSPIGVEVLFCYACGEAILSGIPLPGYFVPVSKANCT